MKVRPSNRILAWLRSHPKVMWIGVSLLVILVAALITIFLLGIRQGSKNEPVGQPNEPAPIIKYYSPLTGNEVPDEASTKKPVTGIMIENSPDARPQSGLKRSGVIFEAIAEGGITRFLVLYQTEKPQLIGPVRSLRLYDIDWFAPFNASIAHIGGSARSLQEVRNGKYRDLDQFFNSAAYWRSTDRYSPHNVYTSFARLDALNKAKGYTSSRFTGFDRVDEKPVKKPNASVIDMTISGFLYNTQYRYNAKNNTYARFQAGQPHLDRESGQITPKVVIAIRVDERTVFEDGYREQIDTLGSGRAIIFQNGTAIQATWHKSSRKGQLRFTDGKGNGIALVRGQTWITAVPNSGGGVTWR